MADFYYVRSDEQFTLYGAVSGGADTNYLDDWLVDGRPGRPARAASGSQTWTITNTAKNVSIVAICNHNVDAARTITIGGDISASTAGPALQAHAIPLNPWVSVALTSVSSMTVGVSSNSVPLVIGEVIAGTRRTLERQLLTRPSFTPSYRVLEHASEFDSLMPYDKGLTSRTLQGRVIVTDSGLADIVAWFDSTRGGARPTLIVPDSTVQDAWVVKFTGFSFEPDKANVNHVELAFEEFPRSRW